MLMLNGQNVMDLMDFCVLTKEETETRRVGTNEQIKKTTVVVPGCVALVAFDRARLEIKRNDIMELLNQLPVAFREPTNFVLACEDRNGDEWTANASVIDELFMLGEAIDKVVNLYNYIAVKFMRGKAFPFYQILFDDDVKPVEKIGVVHMLLGVTATWLPAAEERQIVWVKARLAKIAEKTVTPANDI